MDLSCQHFLRLCFLDCHWKWILENFIILLIATNMQKRKKYIYSSIQLNLIELFMLSIVSSKIETWTFTYKPILATFMNSFLILSISLINHEIMVSLFLFFLGKIMVSFIFFLVLLFDSLPFLVFFFFSV